MAEKTDLEKMGERQDGNYRPPMNNIPTNKLPIPKWLGERPARVAVAE